MKCPYRIVEKVDAGAYAMGATQPLKVQEFAECYGTECPYYNPEQKIGRLSTVESCARALIERINASKENK